MDSHACWECGENGTRTGGLEINHICSRVSSSPLNASILCRGCHQHVGHSAGEEMKLLRRSKKFLENIGYELNEYDQTFYKTYNHMYL